MMDTVAGSGAAVVVSTSSSLPPSTQSKASSKDVAGRAETITKDTTGPVSALASPPILTASPVSVTPETPLVAPMPTSLSNHSTVQSSPSGSRPSSYLATSRPAPASPVPSRPSSVHRPRSGSNSSAVDRTRKSRPRSSLGMDVTSAIAGPSKESPRLKIRDYGFERSDERFSGDGPDAQGNKTSYPKGSDEDDGSNGRGSSWGRFFTGFTGFRGRRRSDAAEEAEDELEPTTDVTYVDMDDDDDEDLSDEASPPSGPDPSGWHRAMYAFEPMGEHEMGLAEGEVVDVLGRGGGSGWVVAVKRCEERTEGLVPEGYLRKLRDGEENEEWGDGSGDDEDEDLGLGTRS